MPFYFCDKCGTPIAPERRFKTCTNCGAPQNTGAVKMVLKIFAVLLCVAAAILVSRAVGWPDTQAGGKTILDDAK